MKLVFIITLALFSTISSTAFAQATKPQKTESEVKKSICHKWQVVSMQIQGEHVPMDAGEDLYYLTFLQNGTFIDSQDDSSPSDNKWTYNHKTSSITTGGVVKKIVLIEEKKLVLSANMDGGKTLITLKNVD